MNKDKVLYHGIIGQGVEIQHEQHQVSSGGRTYEVVNVAKNEEKILQGMLKNYQTMGQVLEIDIHQPKQDVTDGEYAEIFAQAAERMGVSLSQVRPAYHYDPKSPEVPAGLKTLAQMRQVLGLK